MSIAGCLGTAETCSEEKTKGYFGLEQKNLSWRHVKPMIIFTPCDNQTYGFEVRISGL